MNILGISAFYHDSAAALVQDGRIVAAAQEERFTRKRHDSDFPIHAIAYCLEAGGLKVPDLDLVGFYDKPFLKFERMLKTYMAYAPRGFQSFRMAMPLWLKGKLWMKSHIRETLGYPGAILFPEHHESHAASAFFPSPFGEAAIVTMDGVGEWATASIGEGRGHQVRLAQELHFPHSLGLLYCAFTYYTGFKVNSGEYKVMGLAPYGEPKYADLIYKELIDLKADGSLKLNQEYFDYCSGLAMTSEKFHALFGGPPRQPESELTQKEMDLAASVQAVTEEVMLRMARHARKVTGLKDLCLAGGVALNCVGNGRILRENVFERIWIQPASGDAGGALGAALLLWHQYLGKERTVSEGRDSQQGSLLGPSFSDEHIGAWLKAKDIPHRKLDPKDVARETAALLKEGHVIGWFQGRMEFGPRALGSRSIVGDARNVEMQAKMNLKIKFRESFRPFAPSVLAEHYQEYFDLPCESPYMLLTAPVVESRRIPMSGEQQKLWGIAKLNVPRSDLPAITHVDYSARLQTVNQADNAPYHELIAEFRKLTGCGVVVNTSFNVRGEPIVCRPQEAYTCFMRTHMDYLVLGSHLLDKKAQGEFKEDQSWMKEFALD
ncbi:MAG: carbamoyltransferase [Elusimicrobia bacterium]|nr:carbamoyltransferase [Elusimicrobiota bacterium]